MDRFPRALRLIHWLLAGLVLLQLTLIAWFRQLESLEFGQFVLGWHRTIGVLILSLIAVRLIASLFARAPAAVHGTPGWQRLAARLVHWAILLGLAAQVAAGLIMAGARGDVVSMFGLFDLPPVIQYDPNLATRMLPMHRFVGDGIVGLLLIHLGAVAFHAVTRKRNIVARMLARPNLARVSNRIPIWCQILAVCLSLLSLTFAVGFYAVGKTKAAGAHNSAAFEEIVTVGDHIRAGQLAFIEAHLPPVGGVGDAATIEKLKTAQTEFAEAAKATHNPDIRDQATAATRSSGGLAAGLAAGVSPASVKATADKIESLVETQDAAAIGAKLDSEQASAGTHDLILLSILPALLIGLTLATILSSSIIGWIGRVRKLAASIAAGELDNRLTVIGEGEAAKMMRDLLFLQAAIRGHIEENRRLADEQRRMAASEEHRRMEVVGTAASEIMALTDLSVGAAAKQSCEMSNLAQQIAEASNMAQTWSQDLLSVADDALARSDGLHAAMYELARAADDMSSLTHHARNAAEVAAGRSAQTKQAGEQLSVATQEIASILQAIVGIANQTSLVALNATIEAARAGEHGRSFVVVAHEVKALATRTQNLASSISKHLADVDSAVAITVSNINQLATFAEDIDETSGKLTENLSSHELACADVKMAIRTTGDALKRTAERARDMASKSKELRGLSASALTGSAELDANVAGLRSDVAIRVNEALLIAQGHDRAGGQAAVPTDGQRPPRVASA